MTGGRGRVLQTRHYVFAVPVDDEPDDVGSFSEPLPPEDRLWRHPSEMARIGGGGSRARSSAGRSWAIAVVAGLTGAALAAGVVVATGVADERVVERSVLERVAVDPIASPRRVGAGELDAAVEVARPAVVQVTATDGGDEVASSGVLFRSDGHLFTSAHALTGSASIEVLLADGRTLPGTLLGHDELTDIAVVKIEARDLPTMVLGSSRNLQVGSPVVAVGAALAQETPSTVSCAVRGVGRRAAVPEGETLHGMIETDAAVAAELSGGALVDERGSLVGITTAIAGPSAAGSGFATPIEVAHLVAEDIVATGRAHHVWLGVEGRDLTPDEAGVLGIAGGVSLDEVREGSPAARARMAPGDVITKLDGKDVHSMSVLVMLLRARRPGESVTIGLWHEGRYRVATLALEERPADP